MDKSDLFWLPRIAFVHDRLYHMWGAEAVFFDLIKKKSKENWRIFTLFSDKKELEVAGQKLEIVTALPHWIFVVFHYFEKHRTPILSKLFDYRNLMFFYPILTWILRQKIVSYDPDEVVIDSFAAARNVVPVAWWRAHTTIYFHSPMQYIRANYHDNISKLKAPISRFYRLVTPLLRRRDCLPRHYDIVYSNSHYTAWTVSDLYKLSSTVRYPRISNIYEDYIIEQAQDYYIFVGRMVIFLKELDRIVRLFNHNGKRLVMVWDGPDYEYLRSIAHDNIEFVGRITDLDRKMKLVWRARGFVNIARESFGMVTIEALCQWVPVFWLADWGSVELVDEQSGILVQNKSDASLIEAFERFDSKQRDRQYIAQRAQWLIQQHQEKWQHWL